MMENWTAMVIRMPYLTASREDGALTLFSGSHTVWEERLHSLWGGGLGRDDDVLHLPLLVFCALRDSKMKKHKAEDPSQRHTPQNLVPFSHLISEDPRRCPELSFPWLSNGCSRVKEHQARWDQAPRAKICYPTL